MSNIKKAGMLILLLALPAFFFLFLKIFGSNHYDLPYFHPELNEKQAVVMNGQDTVYYRINSVLGTQMNGRELGAGQLEGKINLFILPENLKGSSEKKSVFLGRLEEKLKEVPDVQFFVVDTSNTGLLNPELFPDIAVTNLLSTPARWIDLLKLGKSDPPEGTLNGASSLVLVDGKRHIRGYYDMLSPDDFDRALAEVKILAYQKKLATK